MKNLSERNPVAYFSAEYGLTDQLPIYAGGLGVLAGDFLKGADDLGLPVVGIGLFYKNGYFCQSISGNGQQKEDYPETDPQKAGLREFCTFNLPLGESESQIKVWEYKVGKVKLYLLEAGGITERLYPADLEKRIQQEIVLGIGGSRFLEITGIEPAVYHLNEGHAAFAIVDIVRKHMQKSGLNFQQAMEKAHHKMVFTNHTLVAGGTDLFPRELVKKYLLPCCTAPLGVSAGEFLQMGAIEGEQRFSETLFALRVSCQTNAVSRTHWRAAAKLWPRFKMKTVTNAVHLPTWINPQTKGRPEKLTITWARRFTEYKRPLLIFSDPQRLKKILKNKDYPVRLIFSGKAHPADEEGKRLIQKVIQFSKSKEFAGSVFFVPDYNLEVAKRLIRKSDVWLNTPKKGWEACGTSGMKAAANGVLQWTVPDGWAAEVDWTDKGWVVEDDPNSLYDTLEKEIVPCFYEREGEWLKRSQKTMEEIRTRFNVERMIKEYTQRLYLPALRMSREAEKHVVKS